MSSKLWWDGYRKQKYKPQNRLSLEMIIRKSFMETLKEYIECSSVSGLKKIVAKENSLLQRVLWMVILCLSLIVVLNFLHLTWMSMLTKPLVVSGESFTYPIKNIDFPAVALCNINRISMKALKNKTLELYPKLSKLNMTLSELENFLQHMGRLIDFAYDETEPLLKLMDVFDMKEFSQQTVQLMKELAPNCDEMLMQCLWAGKVVDCKTIFKVRKTIRGHCCAFNYVLDYESADKPNALIEEVKRQSVPGPSNGLWVLLDAMLEDYAYPLVLWMVILCLSLIVVLNFLHLTWMSMLTKPLVVSGESFTYPIKNIDFPAVALCNINRISMKALKNKTLELYPKLSKLNMTLSELENFLQHMGRLIDFAYDETEPLLKLMDVFDMKEFSQQTVQLMKELAPNCDEMLMQCLWAGKVVDCKTIFKVRKTIRGHCCAFNYVLDYESADKPNALIEEVKRQSVPGPSNGLWVLLDAMLEDYAYPLSYRQGFEILIFDPTHFADMTGGRVLQRIVQPNHLQLFHISSIKQIASSEVRKYPSKTRKCLFHDEHKKVFRNMYSYSACIVKCRIQSVQSLCQCTPFFLPSGISTHFQTCTLKNLRCLNKYKEKLQYLYPMNSEDTTGLEQELADSLYCADCWPDCELTQHFAKSFRVPLPAGITQIKGFKNSFVEGINLTNKCLISVYQATSEGILHRLDVVAYWFEILSNIGGFSGMIMGIGIYTIVEFVYFLSIRFLRLIYCNYVKYG
uniref:Sodium channel protein Nach n=1 Tax=Heliothis virescens TaxID=7102 RepID=A0A2A4JYA3_HELVI